MKDLYVELWGNGKPNFTEVNPDDSGTANECQWEQIPDPVTFYFSIAPYMVEKGYLKEYTPEEIDDIMDNITDSENLEKIRLALCFFVWGN